MAAVKGRIALGGRARYCNNNAHRKEEARPRAEVANLQQKYLTAMLSQQQTTPGEKKEKKKGVGKKKKGKKKKKEEGRFGRLEYSFAMVVVPHRPGLASFSGGLLFTILALPPMGYPPFGQRIDIILGAPTHLSVFISSTACCEGLGTLYEQPEAHGTAATALSLPAIGALARMTRASIIETDLKDFVRAAKAKGVTNRRLMWRHVLRNGG